MTIVTSHLPEGRAAVQRHLAALAQLDDADRESLRLTLADTTSHASGDEIIAKGATLDAPRFVVSGWLCRAVTLPDGRRQILDFYIPGDLAGYCSRQSARAKAPYVCLTNVVTASAAPLVARIRERPDAHAGLSRALAAMEDEMEQQLLDQILRTGRMQAHERMAHLLAQLHARHQRAGVGLGNGFVMPLTQETLGEALGLSTVHVNRVLQQLRREQSIRTAAGRIEIANTDFLAANGVTAH